tara:strand:+ start:102 stop:254 length:153 start_codon:yes stop_codon:yes gene_type:complete
MKVTVKHKDTEIVVDDNNSENTIYYSISQISLLLDKMSLEIQQIENNYNK